MKSTDANRYRFTDHYALAKLPYFELRDQRLVISDPSFGPAIDMHTHLGNSYYIGRPIDLEHQTPRTELWLPMEAAIDLDVYVNQNVSGAHRRRIGIEIGLRGAFDPIGGGMRSSMTMPNLARDMRDLGIVRSAVLPIDLARFSKNAVRTLQAIQGRDAFIALGSVHPAAPNPAALLDQQQQLGARGIKLHPNVQKIRPDEPRTIALQRLCADRGLFILWHCGPAGIEFWSAQQRSQVRFYEKAIAEIPHGKFVLGHSGALQVDLALDLARRYDNVWLELSCQSLTSIRRILENGPRDRLLFGSDWPMYHQAIPLAKILIATEGASDLRRQVLHDNALRLLGQHQGTADANRSARHAEANAGGDRH
ncbi:MAG: amidohydrolase family protein [Deltaproteobacteria bacterium]|nr:amidohydrolase family protein [Deltaproteobacteria bacterium]